MATAPPPPAMTHFETLRPVGSWPSDGSIALGPSTWPVSAGAGEGALTTDLPPDATLGASSEPPPDV